LPLEDAHTNVLIVGAMCQSLAEINVTVLRTLSEKKFYIFATTLSINIFFIYAFIYE
jgi:hypothetical protein